MRGSASRGTCGGFTRRWLKDPGRALSRCASSSLPAQRLRLIAHSYEPGRDAADYRIRGDVLCHHCVSADDRVVADAYAAQDAGSVAHPDVVGDVDVALVDALQADGALDFDHAVVEVDQHHAVGHDALAADRDVLVGGDRALLAHHRLGADAHLALVHADLAGVADPGPTADVELCVRADLELHAGADEADAIGLQAPAPAQLQPQPARAEQRVVAVEH